MNEKRVDMFSRRGVSVAYSDAVLQQQRSAIVYMCRINSLKDLIRRFYWILVPTERREKN